MLKRIKKTMRFWRAKAKFKVLIFFNKNQITVVAYKRRLVISTKKQNCINSTIFCAGYLVLFCGC